MPGFVRAVARLALMALVTGAVLVAATALGLPTAAVLGLGVTVGGLVGLLSLARHGQRAASPGLDAAPNPVASSTPAADADRATGSGDAGAGADVDRIVATMAPGQVVDPELSMPRWRRPSLLEARKADPRRAVSTQRAPRRFPDPGTDPANRRIVRYAVVQLLDRPDEVLGRPVDDLMSGDEVEVLDASGSFWEVMCPDGLRGWVHRTTLGAIGADALSFGRRAEPVADDLLTAVLTARGIQ